MRVVALYEFSAEPGSSELSLHPGEYLTVTSQTIGEGWWEGVNSSNQKGLFPAGYVQPAPDNAPITNFRPQIPPSFDDAWSEQTNNQASTPAARPQLSSFQSPTQNHLASSVIQQPQLDNQGADWDEDDWDDDESQSEYSPTPSTTQMPQSQIPPINGPNFPSGSLRKAPAPQIKKSINRFGHFVKSGGEAYILGLKTCNINQNDMIHIIEENGVFKWSPTYFTYTVSVDNPKKESKMKGLKSYIAYQLTPSDTGFQVSRRYKNFDWLHARLSDKFSAIPIPALPDKQISGRYEEDFVQTRRIQLQSWVNRICRHPVLSQATVWKHFITCKDEKNWKYGKRKAEKDELVGGLFFATVQVPENATFGPDTDDCLDKFFRFVNRMDDATKNVYNCSQEMIKKYPAIYKRENQKLGSMFESLKDAFRTSPVKTKTNNALANALNYTSVTYNEIGDLYDKQHWEDFVPLSNLMHEYGGLLSTWPDIGQIYKGAIGIKRKHHTTDGDSDPEIARRADVVVCSTMAEMNHFESERVIEFHNVMRTFLKGQLNLYRNIVSKLEKALDEFPQE